MTAANDFTLAELIIAAAAEAWRGDGELLATGIGPLPRIAASLAKVPGAVVPVNVRSERLVDVVARETDGWGADVILECSGNEKAAAEIFQLVRPGGVAVLIGIPLVPFQHDVSLGCIKEVRVEHVFRYAHVFPRCIAMLASGAIDVAPLITETFPFEQSVEAFEFAARQPEGTVKVQIDMPA